MRAALQLLAMSIAAVALLAALGLLVAVLADSAVNAGVLVLIMG